MGETFLEAWRAGAKQVAELSDTERRRRTVNTAAAWESYPPATPESKGTAATPEPGPLAAAFEAQLAELQAMIDERIEERYLDPLEDDPDDSRLWAELARVYVSLARYDDAIGSAYRRLRRNRDDPQTHNHLGIAHFLKGEIEQAAFFLQQATELAPADEGLRRNYEMVLEELGEVERPAGLTPPESQVAERKGALTAAAASGFYWGE